MRLPRKKQLAMAALKSAFQGLNPYLPEGSLPLLEPLLRRYPLKLVISKARSTKFGDYRLPGKDKVHRISVNGNLNPYAFLITLIHELAHLEAFEHYGARIKPHGSEWQACYLELSQPFFEAEVFPPQLDSAFRRHLAKGKASSASDPQLMRILRSYDPASEQSQPQLEEIPFGSYFRLNDKVFKKGQKSRVRYRCLNLENKREYMVHPLVRVNPIE